MPSVCLHAQHSARRRTSCPVLRALPCHPPLVSLGTAAASREKCLKAQRTACVEIHSPHTRRRDLNVRIVTNRWAMSGGLLFGARQALTLRLVCGPCGDGGTEVEASPLQSLAISTTTSHFCPAQPLLSSCPPDVSSSLVSQKVFFPHPSICVHECMRPIYPCRSPGV